MNCPSLDLHHAWRCAVFLGLGALAVPPASAQQPQQASAAAPQVPAPAAQAVPASRPPVLNRANEVMPAWLRVRDQAASTGAVSSFSPNELAGEEVR